MDRAVIIGVLEFLGFSFCQRILEEGIEVDGIHLDLEKDKLLIEEKRLQIGRNANYNEWSCADLELKALNIKGTVLFVDVYDLFMWENEVVLFEEGMIKRLMDEWKEGEIIFLLPISLKANRNYQNIDKRINELVITLRGKGNSVKSFYLPAINGTWLSEGLDMRDSFDMEEAVTAILELIR